MLLQRFPWSKRQKKSEHTASINSSKSVVPTVTSTSPKIELPSLFKSKSAITHAPGGTSYISRAAAAAVVYHQRCWCTCTVEPSETALFFSFHFARTTRTLYSYIYNIWSSSEPQYHVLVVTECHFRYNSPRIYSAHKP